MPPQYKTNSRDGTCKGHPDAENKNSRDRRHTDMGKGHPDVKKKRAEEAAEEQNTFEGVTAVEAWLA